MKRTSTKLLFSRTEYKAVAEMAMVIVFFTGDDQLLSQDFSDQYDHDWVKRDIALYPEDYP